MSDIDVSNNSGTQFEQPSILNLTQSLVEEATRDTVPFDILYTQRRQNIIKGLVKLDLHIDEKGELRDVFNLLRDFVDSLDADVLYFLTGANSGRNPFIELNEEFKKSKEFIEWRTANKEISTSSNPLLEDSAQAA